MKILIVGAGYVGLVTAANCFAQYGHDLRGIDKDQAKISELLSGKMLIVMPGPEALVANNVKTGQLLFGTEGPALTRRARGGMTSSTLTTTCAQNTRS